MPIYEYDCASCGRRYEELIMTPSQEASVACPVCKSTDKRRRVSRFGFAVAARGGSSFASGGGPGEGASRSAGGGCASCGGGSCSTCGH